MRQRIDLTGKTFGRWKVLRFDHTTSNGDANWFCVCNCGTIKSVNGYNLRSGRSKSCGCLVVELMRKNKPSVKHGLKKANPRLYGIWQGMLNRCRRKKDICYMAYGGRGISVCEEWHQFPPFYEWAMANGYTDDLTIDRINVDGNYEPSNCQWITMEENIRKAIDDRRQKKNGILFVCE